MTEAGRLPLAVLPAAACLLLAVLARAVRVPDAWLDAFVFGEACALVLASLPPLTLAPPPALPLLAAAVACLGGARLAPTGARWVLVDVGLLLAAAAVGGAIGRRVAHPGHLLAASAIAAAADVVSIATPGLPTNAVTKSEHALAWLTISAPVPASAGGGVAPAIGVGDLVFAALVLSVVRAHSLSRARATAATLVGLVLAGALSAALGRAVPALVTLGAAYVALIPEARRVRPEDRRATILAVGALVAAVAWAFTRAR